MSITAVPISIFNHFPASAAGNALQQDFRQLGQDLKTGDLGAAQQDLLRVKSDLANRATGASYGAHEYHVLKVGLEDPNGQNTLTQRLGQLDQLLTSGNLAAAQQAYAAVSNQR